MNRYIRTKDGKIFDTSYRFAKLVGKDETIDLLNVWLDEDKTYIQADTIEELIVDFDCLYIKDLYDDMVLIVEGKVKPFGYDEAITVEEFLKLTSCRELELYTKQGNDYILVAKKENGEWEVI